MSIFQSSESNLQLSSLPTVVFLPQNVRVSVPVGTALLDAASAIGVSIFAPCGGEGVCGDCRVKIEAGSVERTPNNCLSSTEQAEGWALACSSRIIQNVTIRVIEHDDTDAQIVTDAAEIKIGKAPLLASDVVNHADETSARQSLSARDVVEPLIVKRCVTVAAPSLDNSFSDLERLARALKNDGGPSELTCGLEVLRSLAAVLRINGEAATAKITASMATALNSRVHPCVCQIDEKNPCACHDSAEIVRLEPGNQTSHATGLAIDIGTTTCAAQLINLRNSHVIDTACEYNRQMTRGLDIISRINYAKNPERREELRNLVLQTLNGLIEKLCDKQHLRATEIDNVAVVGNTTMIHLLLGLDAEYIRLSPYTPTVNRLPLLRAREVGLKMNPEAFITFAPSVGSYVGGDITAGLLRTALANNDYEVRLFLDIGTNGEIVLGNKEWLMGCACSAGPAFEGAGIGCGMRATRGAIERFHIDSRTGALEFSVVGGGKPRGICGSGMIDLLAELRATKQLDPLGKFDAARCYNRVRLADDSTRSLAYIIATDEQTETGKPLIIDERDIQNLLRAKAAVYSACALMLKSTDTAINDVKQIYVAGGFGRFLDLKKAIFIGILPDLPLDRYLYLGNSALAGARAMLVSRAARQKVQELANRLTYLELNADPAYMDEYLAALFLPHTDSSRFPTNALNLTTHKLML